MRRFVSILLSFALVCSLSVSSFAADSPSGGKTWEDYKPEIVPAPTKEDKPVVIPESVRKSIPEFVVVPSQSSQSSGASGTSGLGRTVISPVFISVSEANEKIAKTIRKNNEKLEKISEKTNGKDAKNNEKADKSNEKTEEKINKIAEKSGEGVFEIVVKETTVYQTVNVDKDRDAAISGDEEEDVDPVKDTIAPEKLHYYAIDDAITQDQSMTRIVQDVIAKADAESRSIVSAFVIKADEDVSWKIGKQENGEDRYIEFIFYPEAIGLTEDSTDSLVVFVNGNPVICVKNPDGSFTIKLPEWGLVTFEIAAK